MHMGKCQVFIFFIISLFVNQKTHSQPFNLKGLIKGCDTATITLSYYDDEYKIVTDSVYTTNGMFQFNGVIVNASLGRIVSNVRNKNSYKSLIIDTGYSSFEYDYNNIDKLKFQHSKSNQEYADLKKAILPESQMEKHLNDSIKSNNDRLLNGNIDINCANVKLSDLESQYKKVRAISYKYEKDYITNHPNSYIAIWLFMSYGFKDIPWGDSVVQKLTESVKVSSIGKIIIQNYKINSERLAAVYPFHTLKVNARAPEFTIYTKKDSLELKNLKGKVVLLEFWSLNCLPCLQFNPSIEKIRKKYEKKGFEVLGITNYDSSMFISLSNYIQKNKLSKWMHISTDASVKGVSNQYLYGQFDEYTSDAIPSTIIIDRNGHIVYKHVGFETDDLKEFEKIVADIMQQ
ncbi:MAG: AhpC/TSA family protein [Chitinophagaceae bacterium]|nr:MAG: AhpC/TSA family protein [Chitinophagaceae bacterium]